MSFGNPNILLDINVKQMDNIEQGSPELIAANGRALAREIRKLLSNENVHPRDYYAPRRYYSEIEGVKNIRMGFLPSQVLVKVTSPSGYNLPKTVETSDGSKFTIEFYQSKNYKDGNISKN